MCAIEKRSIKTCIDNITKSAVMSNKIFLMLSETFSYKQGNINRQ